MSDVEMQVGPPPRRSPWRPLPIALALTAFVTIAALAVLWGGGRPSAPEGPIRLTVALSEGSEFRYRMTMGMDGVWTFGEQRADVEMESSADVRVRVEGVEPDGTMVLSMSMDAMEVSVNGRSVPTGPLPPSTRMRVSPDGRILEAGAGVVPAAGPTGDAGSDQLFPALPEEAIEPGDEWEIDEEKPFPLGEGTIVQRGTGRFLRYEEIDGVLTAVLEVETTGTTQATGDLDAMAGLLNDPNVEALRDLGVELAFESEDTTTARFWVDPESGEVLRSQGAGSMSFTSRPVDGAATAEIPVIGFEGEVSVLFERR